MMVGVRSAWTQFWSMSIGLGMAILVVPGCRGINPDYDPPGADGGDPDTGALCVDTKVDPDHCGGCDSPCAPDQSCVSGVCE